MELNFFMMLWVAYLQVHSFGNGSKLTGESHGTLWTCENDATKTIYLDQDGGRLTKPGESWEFTLHDIGITPNLNKTDGASFPFDENFENWLADAFENIKCNPTSHIDFATKIEFEKNLSNRLCSFLSNQPIKKSHKTSIHVHQIDKSW